MRDAGIVLLGNWSRMKPVPFGFGMLYFVGAIVAHVRVNDLKGIGLPFRCCALRSPR